MRKDVLISLLAITGAPVAALADADVVIDKTAWTGDDLTVSEDGSVTVSTGKEVSIEKELAPGKYMLQRATFTDNAKIVAVYKGKEYAPGVAFTIDSDAPAKVKVKVRAVTPGEFKFSGVKFTLIFDFAAPVKELGAQLGEIVSGTSDYFRRTDAWTKGKDGKPSLEMQVADYASQLDIIEKGDYEVYVKNHLWQGKNSPELRALTDGIAALAKVVEKANDNENAYFSAQNAYEAAEYQFRSFSSTWYTVAEEIRATYQADYNKIQQSINDFKALAREKYDAGEAKELKTAEFTENFNRMLNELEANIGVSDAAWINIYAVYQDGLRVFNAAQEEIHTQMPDGGNYADWNEEALNAMRSAWKKVSDLYKTIDADKTKASELEENFRTLKEAQVVVINATKDEYLAKHVDAEAKKAAADQLLSALEDDFQYLEKSDDVNQKYANRVKEIRTAINALKDKVAKDYKAPHNIRTASYDADRDAIQAKISSLRSDAGAIIQNYENYQKLLKALGTETGLQKKLDDAKAAVAKMKPADEKDTYDVAAHFQKTAAGLQKTIDEIKAAVEKSYQEKMLTETVRGDFQSQIDAAAMAIGKYQDDSTAALDRYDVVSTAIKDYEAALTTLRGTVGPKTLVVATPATEVTGKTYGERITKLQTEIDRVAGNFSAAKEKLDADLLAALLAVQLKETILTDAQALNAAFANDKVNSDKTAKIEAAKAMYDAASKVVDAIKADIDKYKGVPYEYYNVTWTEDNLGLKYDELLQDLNDIEASTNTQKAKIQAVAATEDDITEANAVEAMSLLSVIKGDVDAINDALSELLTRVDAHVSVTSLKAINEAAYARLTEEVAALQKALDDAKAKVAEECPDVAENYAETVETIQSLINAIQSDLDAKNADCALTEASTLDAEAVKGVNDAIAKYINEAAAAQAEHLKKLANEAAYVRLTEEVATVQVRFDEVKATIEKDYANVAAQFVDTEAAIQGDIDQKKAELQAQYEAVKLGENSTIDLAAIKAAVEQLLANAKLGNAKLVANELAYVRLSDEIAAVQARFDEVKATIEKDYANVAAQFADAEAAIQGDIDQKKDELKAQYEAVELNENSTIDLEAIKAAVEQLLEDAKVADAKLVANEAAYVRLSDEIAAVQTRLDEVKATIEKDYAIVAAQFVGVESSIQYDINKKKDELKALYEAVELDENSTIDLETIKTAIEQLLADAKAAAEANCIGSIQRLMSEGATFYTLGGQKVEAPCKGNIYMIRHADGSVKKVYIK